jgi:hypothetical protein
VIFLSVSYFVRSLFDFFNRLTSFGKVVNSSTILLAFLFKTDASHKYKYQHGHPQHKFKVMFFEFSKEVGLKLNQNQNQNQNQAQTQTQTQIQTQIPVNQQVSHLMNTIRQQTPSPTSQTTTPQNTFSQIATSFVSSIREIHQHNFLRVMYTFLRAPVPAQMPNMSKPQLLNYINMCQDIAFEIDLTRLLQVKQAVLQNQSRKSNQRNKKSLAQTNKQLNNKTNKNNRIWCSSVTFFT